MKYNGIFKVAAVRQEALSAPGLVLSASCAVRSLSYLLISVIGLTVFLSRVFIRLNLVFVYFFIECNNLP